MICKCNNAVLLMLIFVSKTVASHRLGSHQDVAELSIASMFCLEKHYKLYFLIE